MKNLKTKAGLQFINFGVALIRSDFHLKPAELFSFQLEEYLRQQLNNIKIDYVFSDGKYYLIDWKSWQKIIEVDWTNRMKYLKEKRDCDNFAYLFSSRMSEIFELNTAGVAHGHVYDRTTGLWKGGHFWNVIVSNDKEGRHLYWYEPMKDLWVKDEKGKRIYMGKWEYRPLTLRFF